MGLGGEYNGTLTIKNEIVMSGSQTDKNILENRSLKLPSIQICVACVAGKHLQKKTTLQPQLKTSFR